MGFKLNLRKLSLLTLFIFILFFFSSSTLSTARTDGSLHDVSTLSVHSRKYGLHLLWISNPINNILNNVKPLTTPNAISSKDYIESSPNHVKMMVSSLGEDNSCQSY